MAREALGRTVSHERRRTHLVMHVHAAAFSRHHASATARVASLPQAPRPLHERRCVQRGKQLRGTGSYGPAPRARAAGKGRGQGPRATRATRAGPRAPVDCEEDRLPAAAARGRLVRLPRGVRGRGAAHVPLVHQDVVDADLRAVEVDIPVNFQRLCVGRSREEERQKKRGAGQRRSPGLAAKARPQRDRRAAGSRGVSDWYGVKDAACPISTKEGGGGAATCSSFTPRPGVLL